MPDSSRAGGPRIQPGAFFVLRSPLLPLDEFREWGQGLDAMHAVDDHAALTRAIESDSRRLRTRLVDLLDRPPVREALFVASPAFASAQESWGRDPHSAKALRLEPAAVRYFTRMSSRPTPFGLFAGCAVGRLGASSDLTTGSWQSCRRFARIDLNYLAELTEALARAPRVRDTLRYRPNPTLHESAGRLRYAESSSARATRSYQLVAVEAAPDLSRVLTHASSGATLAELAAVLIDEEISAEEAHAYLHELVDAQVLLPDLTPGVTGPEPLEDLIAQCGEHPALAGVARVLSDAWTMLSRLDEQPLGVDPQLYTRVHERLSALPVPAQAGEFLRVEMIKRDAPVLGPDVVAAIVNAVELMDGLRDSGNDKLKTFRERFVERYERQEVPLLEVLDEDTGVAFGQADESGLESSRLLRGLAFRPAIADSSSASAQNAFENFLLGRLLEPEQADRLVLELTTADLERHKPTRRKPLPTAFSVMATIAAASPQALAAGDFTIAFGYLVGPSGATMMGRFCHADPALTTEVMSHMRDEEALRPEAIYAEITHLPDGRGGNIVTRPVLRGYEIPVLSRAGVPEARQIPLSDLLVSVQGERVILRSRRLGREIIPRLTTAHNFGAHSLGLYRFLCRLQYQDNTGPVYWTWGMLDAAAFLPRVVVGNIVLVRARWRVERKEFAACLADDEATTFQRLTAWRKRRRIPRYVSFVEPQRDPLLCDFENVLSVRAMIDAARNRSSFFFQECYPSPEDACGATSGGSFAHEVILPLTCRPDADAVRPRPAAHLLTAHQRYFAPGSNWLYAKIYTGTATADAILRNAIAPLVEACREGLDDWFFIRYNDPRWHVRVRFHGAPEFLIAQVLPRLTEAYAVLHQSGAASGLQLDTYQREIERYGGLEAMRLAERGFGINSEAVLQSLLASADDDHGLELWKIALVGMDLLLEDFGFDLAERLRIAREARTGYLRRLRIDNAGFRNRLGARFREQRAALEPLVAEDFSARALDGAARGILATHSRRFRAAVVAPLEELWAQGRVTETREALALAHVHMHVNRFVRSANVEHELVLYDFLGRLYESRLARAGRRVAREVR